MKLENIVIPLTLVASAIGIVGCGSDSSGPNVSTGSQRAVAARASVAGIDLRSIVGLTNFFNSQVNGPSTLDYIIDDPSDPTNQTPLYIRIVTNADASQNIAAYTDAARTAPAGTITNSAPGASLQMQYSNFSRAKLNGTITQTTDATIPNANDLAFNAFSLNMNGAPVTFTGTLIETFIASQGGVSSATYKNSTTPMRVTEGGQTTQLNITNMTVTQVDATATTPAGLEAVSGSGTLTPLDSLGDTAAIQFNANGSSTAAAVTNTGAQLVSVNVDPTGNTTATTYNAGNSIAGTTTLGNIKTLNPDSIAL